MNTATVADLRNNFRRVSAWIEDGQTVEIVRRGRPFARLVPAAEPTKKANIEWPDFAAQRREIWRGRRFTAAEVAEMKRFEQEGEDG